MLSGRSHLVKQLLFIFNVVFVITGIVLISIGASVLADYRQYDVFLEPRFITSAELIVAVGVIVVIVAFFSCCGAIKENYCMTMTFAGILILICVLELAGGVAGYVLRNDVEEVLEKSMVENLNDAKINNNTSKMDEWNELQSALKCCGAKDYKDWYQENSTTLPASCCPPTPAESANVACDESHAYLVNCIDSLGVLMKENALSIGGVGIGIAFVQFLGIVLSCYLGKAIRSKYETV